MQHSKSPEHGIDLSGLPARNLLAIREGERFRRAKSVGVSRCCGSFVVKRAASEKGLLAAYRCTACLCIQAFISPRHLRPIWIQGKEPIEFVTATKPPLGEEWR